MKKELFNGVFALVGVIIGAVLSFYFSSQSQKEMLKAQYSQTEKERFLNAILNLTTSFEEWDDYTSEILYKQLSKDTTKSKRVNKEKLFTWTSDLMKNTYRIVLITDDNFEQKTLKLRDTMIMSMDSVLTNSNLSTDKRIALRDSCGLIFEHWIRDAKQVMKNYDSHLMPQ